MERPEPTAALMAAELAGASPGSAFQPLSCDTSAGEGAPQAHRLSGAVAPPASSIPAWSCLMAVRMWTTALEQLCARTSGPGSCPSSFSAQPWAWQCWGLAPGGGDCSGGSCCSMGISFLCCCPFLFIKATQTAGTVARTLAG